MSFLGDVGSLYMLFLIALLIAGLGMIAKGFIEYLLKPESSVKKKGTVTMLSRSWFKISLISLAGIIILLFLLSIVSSQEAKGLRASSLSGINQVSGMGISSTNGLSGFGNANNNVNTMAVTSLDKSTNVSNNQIQQEIEQLRSQINQLQIVLQNLNNIQSQAAGS